MNDQETIAALRADIEKLRNGDEFIDGCENCEAPLLMSDDYVTCEDTGISGCYSGVCEGDFAHKPCYAYRVGKRLAFEKVSAAS